MSSNKSFPQIIGFIVFCLILAMLTLTIFYPQLVRAEIATTTDWIGLFLTEGVSPPTRNSKSDTVNGNSWVYTSSCTQSPDPNPVLSRDPRNPTDPPPCTFTVSPAPAPGNYEYRMYANDQETTDALINISDTKVRVDSAVSNVSCPIQSHNPRAEGLISAPSAAPNFGNPAGRCVISSQAAFNPLEIPNYATLRSLYYTQSKSPPNKYTALPAPLTFNGDGRYSLSGDQTISSSPSGSGTEVIFIDGNLTINNDISYHTNDGNGGLVFVVSGNVNIDTSVRQIDAVIISSGSIYTAGASCTTNNVTESNPGTPISALTINGSLVSLEPGSIIFCRNLADDANPAEIINQQAKYLVILRDLYADTVQKWSEVQ